MTKRSPFRYFKTSPEIIRLAVMLYVRFPLSLRNVEDLLHERGVDVSHETIRFWWNRFGPIFGAEIRKRRVEKMRAHSNWQWHLDEIFVKINGVTHYLWRAVDHEGEVLESYVTKRRDRKAALKFLRKSMKRYGQPEIIVTDKLPSYGAAMKVIGNVSKQETGHRQNNRAENSHLPFRRRERAMLDISGKCVLYRNSLPCIPQLATTSTRNDTFTLETISNSIEMPLLTSGAVFAKHSGQCYFRS